MRCRISIMHDCLNTVPVSGILFEFDGLLALTKAKTELVVASNLRFSYVCS